MGQIDLCHTPALAVPGSVRNARWHRQGVVRNSVVKRKAHWVATWVKYKSARAFTLFEPRRHGKKP